MLLSVLANVFFHRFCRLNMLQKTFPHSVLGNKINPEENPNYSSQKAFVTAGSCHTIIRTAKVKIVINVTMVCCHFNGTTISISPQFTVNFSLRQFGSHRT